MKHLSAISIFALVCIIALGACSGGDAKKMLLGDTDKYNRTPKQAVEALYNELPNQDIKFMKEAVKFKETDKLSDYQKDEFFKQLKNKKLKVKANKVRERDGYTEVKCTITKSDGSTKDKKFRLYKEDNIWRTEITFGDLQDVIAK